MREYACRNKFRHEEEGKLNIAPIFRILDSRLRGNDGVEGRDLRRSGNLAARRVGNYG
ncbi:MAG: hypothetical protein HAW59_05400, partial [Betaproteobacteria bacterium]|nr:hypothetical protein [Betaproteobacteria bacterium]